MSDVNWKKICREIAEARGELRDVTLGEANYQKRLGEKYVNVSKKEVWPRYHDDRGYTMRLLEDMPKHTRIDVGDEGYVIRYLRLGSEPLVEHSGTLGEAVTLAYLRVLREGVLGD